jgi:uncharacterized protein (DUF2062 family)
VALAFALGVWIAFFPLLGIHTGLALALAFLFRLSRLAVLTGAWVNNPWTMAPMLTAGTLLGCALFRVSTEVLTSVTWKPSDGISRQLIEALRPLLLPYIVGNLILGTICGLACYAILRSVLARRRLGTAASPTGS